MNLKCHPQHTQILKQEGQIDWNSNLSPHSPEDPFLFSKGMGQIPLHSLLSDLSCSSESSLLRIQRSDKIWSACFKLRPKEIAIRVLSQ